MATATFKFVPSTVITPSGTTDQDTVVYFGTITFSAAGDTYVTGGLLPAAGFDLKSLGPYADRIPLSVYVISRQGTGWDYQWAQGTGKLKLFAAGSGTTTVEATTATALSGLTAPGGLAVSTDDIVFEARFPRR